MLGLRPAGPSYSFSTFASAGVHYSSNQLKQRSPGKAGTVGTGGKGGTRCCVVPEPTGDNGDAGASASPGKTPTSDGPNEVGATRPGLSLTTTSLPGAVDGKKYSASLKATRGTTPYSWALVSGSLPKGLTLSASSGTITGTPAAKTTSTLVVTVTDHSGGISVATLKLSVT